MFGIGFFEGCIILLAVLLFVKPDDLPKFVYRVGKIYGYLRNMYDSFMRNFRNMEYEFRRKMDEQAKSLKESVNIIQPSKKEGYIPPLTQDQPLAPVKKSNTKPKLATSNKAIKKTALESAVKVGPKKSVRKKKNKIDLATNDKTKKVLSTQKTKLKKSSNTKVKVSKSKSTKKSISKKVSGKKSIKASKSK